MPEERPHKFNLAIRADLMPWVSYASGLRDMSMTEYINDAIRRDRDAAAGAVLDGFNAFLEARRAEGAQ